MCFTVIVRNIRFQRKNGDGPRLQRFNNPLILSKFQKDGNLLNLFYWGPSVSSHWLIRNECCVQCWFGTRKYFSQRATQKNGAKTFAHTSTNIKNAPAIRTWKSFVDDPKADPEN